jgi:hypothetical protein
VGCLGSMHSWIVIDDLLIAWLRLITLCLKIELQKYSWLKLVYNIVVLINLTLSDLHLNQHFIYLQNFSNFLFLNIWFWPTKAFTLGTICQIFNKKILYSPKFYNRLQYVANITKGICFFLFPHVIGSQIWLNYFLDYSHFDYTYYKILQRNHGP